MATKAEKEDEKAETEEKAKADKAIAQSYVSQPGDSDKPTGMEHWGEGGFFRIDKNGRRVRVDEKE